MRRPSLEPDFLIYEGVEEMRGRTEENKYQKTNYLLENRANPSHGMVVERGHALPSRASHFKARPRLPGKTWR